MLIGIVLFMGLKVNFFCVCYNRLVFLYKEYVLMWLRFFRELLRDFKK